MVTFGVRAPSGVILLACVIATYALTGCATRMELTPTFKTRSLGPRQASAHVRTPIPLDCKARIEISDARTRTSVYYKRIEPEVARNWLEDSFYHIAIQHDYLKADHIDTPTIHLRLEKAYVGHLSTTKSGVVVISAEQDGVKEYYRGRSTSANWWGTAGEYHTALNAALEQAMNLFLDDASAIACLNHESHESGTNYD